MVFYRNNGDFGHYQVAGIVRKLGYERLDTSDGQEDSEFKRGQIAQINLLHYPMDDVMLGTEFIWGEREDISGNTGSDYRIQFSLKVDFDTGDLLRR